MEIYENNLTYDDYRSLRASVGWNNWAEQQTRRALISSLYAVTVREDGKTVAMGRLIGDGLYHLIVDVVVHPEYQGRGIGSVVVSALTNYVKNQTPTGSRASIQLIAEQGKEDFYRKLGFKQIPNSFCGSGMRMVIHKEAEGDHK